MSSMLTNYTRLLGKKCKRTRLERAGSDRKDDSKISPPVCKQEQQDRSLSCKRYGIVARRRGSVRSQPLDRFLQQ